MSLYSKKFFQSFYHTTEFLSHSTLSESYFCRNVLIPSFLYFFRNVAPLNEETMPDVIIDNSQDKNEVIIEKSVTPCQPTPQLHNDIDTPPLQNSFTPAKKSESDMSTVKIEALITAKLCQL